MGLLGSHLGSLSGHEDFDWEDHGPLDELIARDPNAYLMFVSLKEERSYSPIF